MHNKTYNVMVFINQNLLLKKIMNEVKILLENDKTGHGFDHIMRVADLAYDFSKNNNVNLERLIIIALLHDVDDYKLVGMINSTNLPNATNILKKTNLPIVEQNLILDDIKKIGFHNALNGIRPLMLEGQIVSDADMCDALGANGILRTFLYNLNKNNLFFDEKCFPSDYENGDSYVNNHQNTAINHMFEKLLKLKNLMLTKEGKLEASYREQLIIAFLEHFFQEEKKPEWLAYLNQYLQNRK